MEGDESTEVRPLAETIEVGDLPARGPIPAPARAGSGARPRVRTPVTMGDYDARLLQRRVALFGLVGSCLSITAIVIYFIANLLKPGVDGGSHVPHLFAVGLTVGAWAICRGKPRPAVLVRGVETVGTVGVSLCFAVMAYGFPYFVRGDLIAAHITLIVTSARTILVPSSVLRTLVLTGVAWVPSFGVSYLMYRDHPIRLDDGTTMPFLAQALTGTTVWAALGITLVTVTSQVIYGLRREVREAKKLGQYTLLEKLGEGGMGQVFRAQHAMLRRPTAVKLLHPDRGSGPESLARFEREVQLTAQLSHPNVVTVFDFGRTPAGVFYYAMELLDGLDLESVVEREGPLAPSRVVHILSQVASALAEAHAVGLIHRDIKPANIILSSRAQALDVAKVVDFGLVKDLTDVREELTHSNQDLGAVISPSLSKTGAILGTPMYLAPEALTDPTSVDGCADLYALGAVGYYLLTGTTVFGGTTIVEVCRHHLHTAPTPPSQRLAKTQPDAVIPVALEVIIMKCLEKKPANRYRTAGEMESALAQC